MSMKKFFLAIVLSLGCLLIQAQTIHWITFVDTADPNVGEIDINTHKILYSRWVNIINAALAPMGYNSDVQDFYGSRTSPENCKKAINGLNCQPQDIVLFYYVGHGARSQYDKSMFPQMCLAQGDESKFIPVEWVHEQLKTKKARLTVTIGMCCNSYSTITPKDSPTFGVNYGNTYMNEAEVRNIQNLFLQNKGDIIVTSSKPGQTSGACGSDLGPTDYFSYTLIKQFEELVSQKGTPNWRTFFTSISEIVDNVSSQHGRRQTPIVQVNIGTVNAPSKTSNSDVVQEKVPSVSETNNDELGNYLSRCFSTMINPDIAENVRMGVGYKVLELFDAGAQIKTLGQDTDVVVDRESVSDFIDRITTSRLLLKVAWVSGSLDKSGKILELKVREYYRQK